MMIFKKFGTLCVLLLYGMLCLNAQAQYPVKEALAPDLRYGQLENGFTYYIKALPTEETKVSMRLLVKAGSYNQDANQYGMAHFLEHMPFVRTEYFVHIRKDLELLNKIQMQPEDIGGITGGNQTNYWFDYPSGNTFALQNGLLFFKDIASGNIKFHEKEVDGERGSFFEEYLFSGNEDLYNSLKIVHSFSNRYSGLKSPRQYHQYIREFKLAPLKRFYKKWYHPDHMAIVCIGSIENVEALEQKIKSTFGSLQKPSQSLLSGVDTAQDYLARKDQFIHFQDSITSTEDFELPVNLHFYIRKNKNTLIGTEEEQELLQQLLAQMIDKRLQEAQADYNIPYTIHAVPAASLPALKVQVTADPEEVGQATKKTFSILHQIQKEGFTPKEWETFQQKQVQYLEEVNTQSIDYWKKLINNHFVLNYELVADKQAKKVKFWKSLSLEKCNAAVKNMLSHGPEDIAVISPKNKPYRIEEHEVRKWIKDGKAAAQPYMPPKKIRQLIPLQEQAQLQLLPYSNEGKNAWGAQQLKLKNGITLILQPFQPTTGRFKNKIMLHGFTPYGASSFPKDEYYSTVFAPQIIKHTGVGTFNKFQLRDFLKETSMHFGARTYISAKEAGVKVEVLPEDLETALQFIYLSFTHPRKEEKAFRDWKRQVEKSHIKEKNLRVKLDFYHMIHNEIGNLSASPQGSDVYRGSKKVQLDKTYENYKSLMQNPESFTVMVTGDFKIDKALPLFNRYLGNIPQQSRALPKVKTSSKKLPKRPFTKIYHPKTFIENTHLFFSYHHQSQDKMDLKKEIATEILAGILNFRMKELRLEKKRAVYLSLATIEINRLDAYHAINIILSCSNEDVGTITEDLKTMITEIKNNGVGEELFQKVMKFYILPKYNETKRKQNEEIQKSRYEHERYQVPLYQQKKVNAIIRSIDKEYLNEISKVFLADQFLMKFIATSETEL